MYRISVFALIFLAIGISVRAQTQTAAVRTAAVEGPATTESDRIHVLMDANELISRAKPFTRRS